jgi:hypothetical protein
MKSVLLTSWLILFVNVVHSFAQNPVSKPELSFKFGPVRELKWIHGPVSLGMVMDLSVLPAVKGNGKELLVSRIWDGLYTYPVDNFSADMPLKKTQLVGKAGILLFQPVDWDKDGVADLIAADREGFLFMIPGSGASGDARYRISEANIMRDASTGLPFNIPYENKNYLKQDDLGGYIDAQYYNYNYPKIYPSADSKFKDLIIGDWAGNLWWLPDRSNGAGMPSYTGTKYTKVKSNHKLGIRHQNSLGLDYAKPSEKIEDESGKPFLLGEAKAESAFFQGANTRPIVYPDESGTPGLLVFTGSYRQQIFYLKRVNPPGERKPIFRNMGEVNIAGLDQSTMNFHAILTVFENNGRNDLLLASDNYLGLIENTSWKNGIPQLKFLHWMSGPDAKGSFYAFNDIIKDRQGRRHIIHFAGKSWNMIPIQKNGDNIRLKYTDALQLKDQNGIFKVEGETDPQLAPDWGYHRISLWNAGKSGQNLIAATDKGHLYYLNDESSLAKKGNFLYRSFGPLKDSTGKVIRIHNRAVAAGIDLNDDGLEDLLVGGISYQLGIKSDPKPGGGVYYLINLGNDSKGCPIFSPARQLDLGPDFKPRMNSHIGLQVLDIDNDKEKEIIISLQEPGWDGRIYKKIKGKIGLSYTGAQVSVKVIKEQILDIVGDGHYDLVRPGGETGVGYYRRFTTLHQP